MKVDHSIEGHGLPVFRIHGELKHLSGSLLPDESEHPSYSQLYIYNSDMAYRYQISRNDNLSLNTMRTLQLLMWDYNAYTPIYQHAYEVLQSYDAPNYTVRLCIVPGNDPCRYNLPDRNIITINKTITITYSCIVSVKVMLHMHRYTMSCSFLLESLGGIMNCRFITSSTYHLSYVEDVNMVSTENSVKDDLLEEENKITINLANHIISV